MAKVKPNRGKTLVKGSFIQASNLFLQLLIAFFMMPFIIHSLGNEMYGLWTVVGVFVGYYEIFDLGLASAVARYVSKFLGQDDPKAMNRIINTSLVLFTAIGVFALLVSYIASVVSPYFISKEHDILLFQNVIIILGLSMAIEFPMRVFDGILTSHIRFDLSTYAKMVKLIIANILFYFYLKNGYGILALAIISLGAGLAGHILRVIFAKIVFPALSIGPSHFQRDQVRLLFGYSGSSFAIQIADILKSRIDAFVIAGFLNLTMVTYYAVGQRIISYFSMIIQSIFAVIGPVFSHDEGEGNYDKIRMWFLISTKVCVIVSVFIGASIMYYGNVFIERWIGPGFISSYYVMLIICGFSIIALMQHPSVKLLYAISKHHYYAVWNFCEGVLNLVLSLILVRYYGIYGVAMGTGFTSIVFKLFIQPVYTCRVISLPLYKYCFHTLFLTSLKTLVPLLIYFYYMNDFLKADYLNIILIGGAQAILFLPVAYFLLLNGEDRILIKKLFGLM